MSESKGLPPSLLDISNFSDGGLKVLVVEDNDSDFELMCYRLKQGGLKYTIILGNSNATTVTQRKQLPQ